MATRFVGAILGVVWMMGGAATGKEVVAVTHPLRHPPGLRTPPAT